MYLVRSLKLPTCPRQKGTKTSSSVQNSCYCSPTHLFHAFYFRDVELEHVLYPVLQGDDGAGTAGARPLQLQLHNPILEAFINNIPTILLHRWPEGIRHSI